MFSAERAPFPWGLYTFVACCVLLVPGAADRCVAAPPTLGELPDVQLLSGSPLHVPLNGMDADGDLLSFTVTSDDPLVTTFVPQGNRSMRISVGGFGDMVFELFEGRAPRITQQIVELAQSGDYDGVAFHRVIDNFMIQTGDITNGDGTGGSRLSDIDDQFHTDLQHNRSGVLSMAKGGDDSNDSQFFITEVPTRHLDFNHSIFGLLVEGEAVRDSISNVATNAFDRPLSDVVMESVTVFADVSSAVLMLSAAEGSSGTAEITVTVSDGMETFDQTFGVTVSPDPWNGGPCLEDISPIATQINTAVSFPLTAVDVEGDAVFFDGVTGPREFGLEVEHQTGVVAVTPPNGFVGVLDLLVGVRAAAGSNTGDTWDTQALGIRVLPEPMLGDMDQDGNVNFDDVDELVLGLSDPLGYAAEFVVSPAANGDTDGDSDFDFDDIPGFVALLGSGSIQSVPEPSSVVIAILAALGFMGCRRT
jgi:cyclophilin family peptidyl-prolyl cis-trans isomerase